MAHRRAARWETAVVRDVVAVAGSVRRVVLDVPGLHGQPPPGAHVDVLVPGSLVRSYSVVDDGRHPDALSVAVRRDADSRGGSAFMHALRPGDEVTVSQPLQSFELTPRRVPCVLLAGGIGITPLIGMARALRSRAQDYRLVYAGRDPQEMAFLEELRDEHGDRMRTAIGAHGQHVDLDRLVADLEPGAELYVCGPPRMLAAATEAWAAHDRSPDGLRFESFGSGGTLPTLPFEIEVPRLGLRTTVATTTSAVEALGQAGAEVLTDCLRGECGLCVVPVLDVDGTLDHRDVFLSPDQKRRNQDMALCVSRVAGGAVSIDVP